MNVCDELIVKAIEISCRYHDGQRRKGSDTPYIVHPIEVAMILQSINAKRDVIIAGLLHDTLEDTNISQEIIVSEFGEKVLDLIKGASEELKNRKNRSWHERKNHTLKYLITAPKDVKLIACADKLSNLRSMIRDYKVLKDELWNRFNNTNKIDHLKYYEGLVESLSDLKDNFIYEEFKEKVEILKTLIV